MKKVAIVYHWLPHYRQPIFTKLAESVNIEYTFISDIKSNTDIKVIDKCVISQGILRWQYVRNIWLFNGSLLWQRGLLKICFFNKFDQYIFLGNVNFLSTWVATIILRIRGKRVYFWTHGVTSQESGIKFFIKNLFFRLANGLLLYGNLAKNYLISNGYPSSKLYVIYNSLDYDNHKKIRSILDTKENSGEIFLKQGINRIVFIGRLIPDKKLHLLIEAISILANEELKLNVILVGDGPEKEKLKKLVKRFRLEGIINFYGECYDDFLNAEFLFRSDLCVSPGPVGLTAIHSMTFGTPVVTQDLGKKFTPEAEVIINGQTGSFYLEDDANDLAKVIRTVLCNLNNDKSYYRNNCIEIIDSLYNPKNQSYIINEIIEID